jgi:hypothetical protein
MPQIIVTADQADVLKQDAVTLRERVSAADFESERFAVNLVERLGWAVEDATAAEHSERPTPRDAPEQSERQGSQLSPGRDRRPVGIA